MNIPHEVVYIFLSILIGIQGYMLREIISMKVNIGILAERVDNVKSDGNNHNVVTMRMRK